ncbi:hypothetical protein EZV62_016695 [Acer yangbiense]|uniref:Legume lectin domain-containing protein n=1 Tax=Acer yangbiense TaxID=1000413 RepID=A0A5C7HRD6_9ROSI|nr:hypothetical protein EZV62_016695 [Acer yangbiense]
MELALTLGLICSHQRIEVRPTMRQVMRYLNGDDILPFVDDWGSADYSQQGSEFGSRIFQISDGTFKTSHRSYSYHSLHSYSSSGFSSSSMYFEFVAG